MTLRLYRHQAAHARLVAEHHWAYAGADKDWRCICGNEPCDVVTLLDTLADLRELLRERWGEWDSSIDRALAVMARPRDPNG